MQVTVSHPTYGIITYEESAWTGKKKIAFDGIPLLLAMIAAQTA